MAKLPDDVEEDITWEVDPAEEARKAEEAEWVDLDLEFDPAWDTEDGWNDDEEF